MEHLIEIDEMLGKRDTERQYDDSDRRSQIFEQLRFQLGVDV